MLHQKLRIAAMQTGRRGYAIERDAGFWPGKLSKIFAGIISPTEEDKEKLSQVIKKPKSELFPAKSSTPVEAA